MWPCFASQLRVTPVRRHSGDRPRSRGTPQSWRACSPINAWPESDVQRGVGPEHRSVCQELFVMSGSCRARDAGPAVILVMACPAPTGCPSSPLAELRNQVPTSVSSPRIKPWRNPCVKYFTLSLRRVAADVARGEESLFGGSRKHEVVGC